MDWLAIFVIGVGAIMFFNFIVAVFGDSWGVRLVAVFTLVNVSWMSILFYILGMNNGNIRF